MSPFTRIFLDRMAKDKTSLPANYIYRTGSNNITYVAALLKVNGDINEEALNSLGIKIGTKAGNIWTARIPVHNVHSLTLLSGLDYIQLDEPVHASLDSARRVTRVDSVHNGLGSLSVPFRGTDVVVGVIDAGFDYRHPTLFDTTGARYRVKRIWEQVIPGTPPTGFTYGNEISDTVTMWSSGTDLPGSHGAHVSGIAAGSGFGSNSNSQFRGVADDADMVFVGITPPPSNWTSTGMSAIIDGMSYIYNYAASVGKPAVANLSWGCSIGSHDGLSLFSQACDNLTGPGKLFVCSAGNNGDQKLHLNKSFSPNDSLVHTFLTFSSSLGAKKTWLDIWGDSSKSFCVQLTLFHGANRIDSTGFICLDNQLHNVHMIGSNADTFFATVTTSAVDFNGKPRIFFDIHSKVGDSVLVSVKAHDGNVHIWSGFVENTTGYYADLVTYNFPFATPGNTISTIGDMASTRSALAVGAYCSKRDFINVSGSNVSYSGYAIRGQIAPFSSRGPSVDGRIKPDITAPGLVLGSAVSSYDPSFLSAGSSYSSVVKKYTDPGNSKEYSYAMLMGTSMSSPVASGIVALMLQANPSLTPLQVRQILAETALKDNYTGPLPAPGNNTWGAGKINAMGAVIKALVLSIDDVSRQVTAMSVHPNPAQGYFTVSHLARVRAAALLYVFDVTGKVVFSSPLSIQPGANEFTINTTGWAAGVYIVSLHSVGGTSVARVVVE